MVSEHRWEEPLAKPLYVTFRRAADLLDVSYERMRYLSYLLDTPHFGENGSTPRVSMASIDEFIAIRDAGEDPFHVLAVRKRNSEWNAPRPSAQRWSTPPTNSYWRRPWRHYR